MHTFRWLAVCAAASVAATAWAQEKINLTFNPEPGFYVVKQEVVGNSSGVVDGQSTTGQTRGAVTVEMSFGPPNAAGKRNVKLVYRRAQLEITGGRVVFLKYDSAKDRGKSKNPAALMYDALIDKVISATLDADGKVLDDKGLDELIDVFGKAEGKTYPVDSVERANYRKLLRKDLIEQCISPFPLIPGKPVAKGDSWKTTVTKAVPLLDIVSFRQTSTLTDIKDNQATIVIKATMAEESKSAAKSTAAGTVHQANITIEGTALMDVATGLAMSETLTQKGTISLMIDKNEVTMSISGTVKHTMVKGTYKTDAAKK